MTKWGYSVILNNFFFKCRAWKSDIHYSLVWENYIKRGMGDILYKNLLKKWPLLFSIIYFIKAPCISTGSAQVSFHYVHSTATYRREMNLHNISFFRLTDEINKVFRGLSLLRRVGSTGFSVSQWNTGFNLWPMGKSSSSVWWPVQAHPFPFPQQQTSGAQLLPTAPFLCCFHTLPPLSLHWILQDQVFTFL